MADTELIVRIAAQDAASRNIKNLQSSIIRLVGAVASLAAAFKAITFPVQESIEFERALREIQKTTEFTDDAVQSLGESLRELATDTGVAATDLAEIAARAGQLGLGREGQAAILAFTDTISRFAVVADLSVDEAATSIAKIANIFQIPIDQSERVASAFNELSNTTAATADQLIDVVRRVGDAAGLLEFTDTLGLAAQALELGQTPEVAGTAIIKTFSNAQVKAEEFARVLNITTQEWATAVQTDGVGAIQNVAAAIAKLGTLEQGNLIKELFGGGRQFAFGAKLVQDAGNNFNILARTLDTATQSFADATSAQREYDRLTDSTSRQTEILQTRFNELALTFGDKLLPVVRNVVDRLNVFLEDDAVQGRIILFGEAVATAAEGIAEFVAGLASGEESFQTFFNIAKAFIGLGLASVLTSILGAVTRLGARFIVLGKVILGANASAKAFRGTLADIAAGASAASIAAGKTSRDIAASTAAGLTAVNTLTREQIALQTRRNQLEKAFSVTRARLVREAVQQSRAAGQSIAAQGARARAVRDAVNQGVAQRGADRAILGNLQRQIRGVNLSLAQSEITAGKATRAFRGFGGILRVVGGTLFRFLTGPVGLLLTVFGGPIVSAIGDFFDSGTEAVSEKGAKLVKEAEDVAKELQRVVGVYQEILTKGLPDVDVQFSTDVEEFSKGLGTALTGIKQLFDGVKGVEETQRRLVESSDVYRRDLVDINNLIREQEDIISQANRVTGVGRQAAQRRAAAAREEADALIESRDEINAKLQETETLADQAGASVAELNLTLLNAASSFGGIVDEGQINVLRQVEALARLREEAEKAARAARTARNEAEKAERGTPERRNLDRIAADAERVAGAIRSEVLETQQAVEANAQLLGSAVLAPLVPIAQSLSKESKDTVDNFFDLLASKSQADALVDTLGGFAGALLESVAGIVIAEQQIDAFGDLGEQVEATAKSIRGLFDNLDTSARSTRQRVQGLNRDLDAFLVERDINLKVRLDDQFGSGGLIGRTIDRIEEGAQRRIDRIDTETAAGRRRVRGIERERDTRVAALRVQEEDNKAKQEAEKRDRSRELAIVRFRDLQQKLATTQAEIANADPDGDPAAIQAQRERIERANLLSVALNKQFQAVEKLTTGFTQFQGTERIDAFNESAGEQFIVTQEDAIRAQADLNVLSEELISLRAKAVTESDEAAVALANQTSQLTTAASTQKLLTEQAQQQAKALNLSNGELQLLIANARLLRRELSDGSRLSTEQFQALQLDLGAALTPVAQKEFSQFVSVSVLTGVQAGLQEAVNKSLLSGIPIDVIVNDENIAEQISNTEVAVPVDVPINAQIQSVDGIDIPGVAGGGHVRGPGTSTSDSILARLSDGEYVMDAFTTRRFGANFFRSLQRAARTGNPFSLPGFAAGGLVGDTTPLAGEIRQLGELASRSGARDEVDLNFNIGDERIRLSGDRAEVARLTRALRSVSRGGAR